MKYKGFSVTVSISLQGATATGAPTYVIYRDDEVVHEGSVLARFTDTKAAENAAYGAARQWIDAKCRPN